MTTPDRPPAQPDSGERNVSAEAIQVQLEEGIAAHQQGELAKAQACYRQVLASHPGHSDALYLSGVIAAQTNDLQRAADLIGQAVAINPGHAAAHYTLGNVLMGLGQYDEALASYDQSVRLNPGEAWAHLNRGNALKELRRFYEALASYDQSIGLNPALAMGHLNRGNILLELTRFDDALASYDQAIQLDPAAAEPYYNRGNALSGLRRLDEALASFNQAIAARPDYAIAYVNRGIVLKDMRRLDEAAASCNEAVRLQPDLAEAHNNLGVIWQELWHSGDSLASCDRAIHLRPDYADAHFNRGIALIRLKRMDEALASFNRAIMLNPDLEYLHGMRLHLQMQICDWSNAGEQTAELIDKIERGQRATTVFPVLALSSSLTVQRKAAEIFARDTMPGELTVSAISNIRRPGKIRIGYYSADFYNHPTTYLMAGLFEQHDRSRFEIAAFSFGPDIVDEMSKRVSGAFDTFLDVRFKSDREVAVLSREMGIDIAVDLKGYTVDARHGIFSYRAAPVQVNYLGYPGTMGADCMDYLIADERVIPRESRQYYSEKIVYLPGSYQVNDCKREIADRTFTREEAGLPAAGFVFCCFNANYKITPSAFDGWMRILRRVEGSVLWLLESNPVAAGNLRKEAEARGIGAERLIFAKRVLLAEHLARQRVAGLFLDTLPYNAHTTASDALWAGLPVLTRTGDAFASRVVASLLHAVDLPELITRTQEAYEALAVELAGDPGRLAKIKQQLAVNRLTAPLFDTRLYARHIENAYTQMVDRYRAGLPPDHLEVAGLIQPGASGVEPRHE